MDPNVGLATRALASLNANNLPAAISFAEQAVEKSPNDAGYRALLGNAYFAAGRFASAEAAYRDSLTVYSNQPKVILKLALVETALGKKNQAVAFLDAGRDVLDPSDYGLALALAGRPTDAVAVLEPAARQQGADAQVRQNLALAYALSDNWTEARTVAAQDVPAAQLDGRIQQWMQLASPKRPSDQVAQLLGVTPAAVDRGEPVRLALAKSDTMMAAAAPAPASSVAQPQVVAAAPRASQPPVVAEPKFVEAVAAPSGPPQATPAIAPAPPAQRAAAIVAQTVAAAAVPVAMMAAAAPEAPSALLAMLQHAPAPVARPKAHRVAAVHRAPRAGDAVVQLGAYRSPAYVNAAWNQLTQRHPALRAYLPLRARFDSPKGTFYRLSIQGFSSQREAIARCALLKSRGGNCFVRGAAGDMPVTLASN
jgi:D-alanyl-D-alanine carboxypeptidase